MEIVKAGKNPFCLNVNNKRQAYDDHTASVQINGLSVHYGGKTALKDVTVELEKGKITGIIGPNGAGKSTLIKGIMKLVPCEGGQISVNENSIEKYRKDIAYVEQRSEIDLSFPISVFDTVLLGTYPKLGVFRRPKQEAKLKAKKALETVQMSAYADRQIGELSGGQLQRVFIARALAQEAEVFLLDEPFVGIDMVSEELIMKILSALRNQGKTIAIVHHDLHKVVDYFDNVIILNKNLVAAGSVKSTFTSDNIKAAYGDTLGPLLSFEEDEYDSRIS